LADALYGNNGSAPVEEVARLPLPTSFGRFEARAFRSEAGHVYVALIEGDIGDGTSVLARVHSECLTGDALGSLRCDCGIQLRESLRAIRAAGRGVLVYATGHEGRGIGLVNKLRAYIEQDRGADTVDANLHIGMPVDLRDYGAAAAVLTAIGVRTIRLMTNNPAKVEGLEREGLQVDRIEPLPVAPHRNNLNYLRTKEERLGHVSPLGTRLATTAEIPADVGELLGDVRVPADRPYVVLKYAQTLDGRIATCTGDARWISSEEERSLTHALRARCDAIAVGVGTVLTDDPRLTVRLVAGASPLRVVFDSTLRSPLSARVFDGEAPTLVMTTDAADPHVRAELEARSIGVRVVRGGRSGLDIAEALGVLRGEGVETVLVEGGGRVITSLLASRCVDRLIVSLAPIVMGSGVQSVGDLGTKNVADSVVLEDRSVHVVGRDVLIAGNISDG
jgi:GTP cyclohydrolase II